MNMQYHLALRTTLYNYASTFGMKPYEVRRLAKEIGFRKVTLEAYRAVREEIHNRNGGNNDQEKETQPDVLICGEPISSHTNKGLDACLNT